MARGTPEETFAEARAAMERGDWRHGIPEATIADIRARGRAIIESPRQPLPAAGPAMLEQSRRHQQLVKAYQQAQEDALDSVADMASFTGALERAVRADGSGGSVSANLFVGESLEGVSNKNGWYIRLFARRR